MEPYPLSIRPASEADAPGIVAIGRELVRDGTTYFFTPDTSDAALRDYFLPRPDGPSPAWPFVAVAEDGVVGCYVLRPNKPGRGGHVANASYAVAERARGKGVGTALCRHSLEEARRRGFAAMQFNFVVSTNPALELWKRHGFRIVGTLPRAFEHPSLGRIDACVLYREL